MLHWLTETNGPEAASRSLVLSYILAQAEPVVIQPIADGATLPKQLLTWFGFTAFFKFDFSVGRLVTSNKDAQMDKLMFDFE